MWPSPIDELSAVTTSLRVAKKTLRRKSAAPDREASAYKVCLSPPSAPLWQHAFNHCSTGSDPERYLSVNYAVPF